MIRVRPWLRCAALLYVSACSTPASLPAAGAATGGASGANAAGSSGSAGASGAGAIDGGSGRDGGSGLRVSIQASDTTLCPGQCAELLAIVENGRAPFTFMWDRDLAAGAGPNEVCPNETTTYEVIARDTALDGEFGTPSQEASFAIEIEVASADSDACGHDGGLVQPPNDERELCAIEIAFEAGNPTERGAFGNGLSTDEHGNLYFAGSHDGTIDLDGAVITLQGGSDAFAAKYDADCKLIWSKVISCPSCVLTFSGSDVGPTDLIMVGNARAELDLGVVSTGERWVDAGLLLQLDRETGELKRGAVYEAPNSLSSLWDVGVDAQGDITFLGYALEPITIEGAPLYVGDQMFLAKITAAGEHLFSYPIYNSRYSGRIAVHPDGDIALTAWAEGGVAIGGTFLSWSAMGFRKYVATLAPDGQYIAGRELDPDIADGTNGYTANAVAIDHDHNVLIEHHTFVDDTASYELPEQLTKLAADGSTAWTREISVSEQHWTIGAKGAIAADTHGNIIHTDEVEVGPPVTGDRADNDVLVRKLASDGTELWQHKLDTHRHEIVWGLAISPDDSIWVGHGAFAGAYPDNGTLRITKLAP